MSVSDNNRNGSGGLPTSVMDPAGPIVEHQSTQDLNKNQEPAPKFATRTDVKGVEGISKSKLILLGGGLAIAVLFFVFTAIVGKSPKKLATVKQASQFQQAKQGQAVPPKGSVTPLMDTPRTPAPDNTAGQLGPGGLRRDVRGAAVENNKRHLLSVGLYGSFLGLTELKPGACPPYPVPPSSEAELSYRGLPYDLLEDLLPQSGAWKQAAPLLMPHEDVATGRPITPLHGGHVGLLCTAGLLNGVFGQGDDRHIARWRSVKHVTTFVEQDGDAEIIHHRERWANELYLVYADGRTLKLTETPAKKEDEADGECTPAVRAA